jgi:hypothetical protein
MESIRKINNCKKNLLKILFIEEKSYKEFLD